MFDVDNIREIERHSDSFNASRVYVTSLIREDWDRRPCSPVVGVAQTAARALFENVPNPIEGRRQVCENKLALIITSPMQRSRSAKFRFVTSATNRKPTCPSLVMRYK